MLRDALAELARGDGDGEAVGCSVEAMAASPTLRVRFGKHAHAERALDALHQQGRSAALEYNDRAYDGIGGRSWCIAEQGAATAVAAHLKAAQRAGGAAVPERFRRAEASRPKVVELSAGGVARELEVRALPLHAPWEARRDGTTPGERLQQALEVIERATFTGKGDKPKVQLLLAKLEWLIRGAVEEDAASRGLDGRTRSTRRSCGAERVRCPRRSTMGSRCST